MEAARAEIENKTQRPWRERVLRWLVFRALLPSRVNIEIAGALLYLYQASGLKWLAGMLEFLPARVRELESLAPEIETPFFFAYYGKTLPAEGARRYRVALLGGCIANISFARLNEATVRVLRKNGCEVSIPANQSCCGALHVHAGIREEARKLARRNIDALLNTDGPEANFDAIITNAGGCGSTLKEYGELLEHDPEYAEKAPAFLGSGEGCERISCVHRAQSGNAPAAAHGHLSGLVPFSARSKDSLGAEEAAGVRAWARVAGDAVSGSLLRERGHL